VGSNTPRSNKGRNCGGNNRRKKMNIPSASVKELLEAGLAYT